MNGPCYMSNYSHQHRMKNIVEKRVKYGSVISKRVHTNIVMQI